MSADPLQQWPVPKPGERPIVTPGPWAIAPETNGTELVAYTPNPWRVRAVLCRGDFSVNPNWRADTKAIAAVPVMIAALQLAVAKAQPLTGQGEDYIWRPANAIWEAAVAALREAGVLPDVDEPLAPAGRFDSLVAVATLDGELRDGDGEPL